MANAKSSDFTPNTVYDFLFGFDAGVDTGTSPLLIPKNQLAFGSNLTTRGDLIHPRPPRRILTLNFPDPSIINAVTQGLWQGGCYYKPDVGVETLVASISGRLFQFTPVGTVATVIEVTGGNPQSPIATQCWLIQAENFVFWNDGISLPVFFNGTTTARSNGSPVAPPSFTTFTAFTIPSGYNINSVPPPAPIAITLTGNFTGANGDTFVLNAGSTFPIPGTVVAGTGTPNITVRFNIFNISPPHDLPFPAGLTLIDTQGIAVRQFPVGRQMAYARERVWMALADGFQFIAGDIVGGPSGTKALNFRDAILNVTENDYLIGGGTFRVPGPDQITAMIETATLDSSLGQGPLMVFTHKRVFSCNAPVDRLTWQSLTNPLLTVAAIGNGALGQYSTFLTNSDTIYRSPDGIRSLILAAQDFNLWIRTPISHEVTRVLFNDNQALLPFGSGAFFDNRMLMTVSPQATATQGVFHKGLVALNDDLLSTVREKQPPAYDGLWPGLNIFQMMTGEFSLVERLYQFCFNTVLSTLELWEQLPESAGDVINNPTPVVGDNGTQAIEWWFESHSMTFGDRAPQRNFKNLVNGEIFVDELVGRVDFQAFYKPDQYPCWIPWLNWSECAVQNTGAPKDNNKPGFRPRMGLGTPSMNACDPFTNRPFTNFYTMQFKLVITGQCEFIGARFGAVTIPEPAFAAPSCNPVC